MIATRARHTLRLFHPPESVPRFVDEARVPFSLECVDKLYEANRIVRDADPTIVAAYNEATGGTLSFEPLDADDRQEG